MRRPKWQMGPISLGWAVLRERMLEVAVLQERTAFVIRLLLLFCCSCCGGEAQGLEPSLSDAHGYGDQIDIRLTGALPLKTFP